MEENFSALNQQSERELLTKIMSRLGQERRLRALRRRLILTISFFVPLLAIAGSVWNNFWLDLSRSGLIDYLSLVTTDAKIVLANWQNFSLGFLESFPVVSTMAILSVLLAWLVVIRLVFKYGQEFIITQHTRLPAGR